MKYPYYDYDTSDLINYFIFGLWIGGTLTSKMVLITLIGSKRFKFKWSR